MMRLLLHLNLSFIHFLAYSALYLTPPGDYPLDSIQSQPLIAYSATSFYDVLFFNHLHLVWSNEKVKYDEYIGDNSSSADQSAKGGKGFPKVQGLPHGYTNLIENIFDRTRRF